MRMEKYAMKIPIGAIIAMVFIGLLDIDIKKLMINAPVAGTTSARPAACKNIRYTGPAPALSSARVWPKAELLYINARILW